MKKFVFSLALEKLAFLIVFGIFLFTSCQRVGFSQARTSPIASPTSTPTNSNVNTDYLVTRPTSEPYTGDLSIFEDENRARNLQIDRVMDILKIQAGKTVADIGAGSGWFTVRAAKRVGEKGKVFAVEINQDYINYINDRAKKENFSNIETVLGAEDDPKLPKNSVDAVLILKTYHEIAQPIQVLKNLRPALTKDARVGIIDRHGAGDDHGVARETVIEEAKQAGFSLVEDYDFVKPDGMDYFLVFQVAQTKK